MAEPLSSVIREKLATQPEGTLLTLPYTVMIKTASDCWTYYGPLPKGTGKMYETPSVAYSLAKLKGVAVWSLS